MAKLMTQTEVQLDPQGRLVIPAQLRRSLGFESGDSLIARTEDGRLILEKVETIKQSESPRVLWRLFGLSNTGRIRVV